MNMPRVGVGAFILDENQNLLLVLRKRAPEADHWSIPGGKVDFMERLEDTVRREVFEELGVTVRVERLLCITDHLVPEEQQHWVAPTYVASIVEGIPSNREPEALGDVRWFHLHALPESLTSTTRRALEVYHSAIGSLSIS